MRKNPSGLISHVQNSDTDVDAEDPTLPSQIEDGAHHQVQLWKHKSQINLRRNDIIIHLYRYPLTVETKEIRCS